MGWATRQVAFLESSVLGGLPCSSLLHTEQEALLQVYLGVLVIMDGRASIDSCLSVTMLEDLLAVSRKPHNISRPGDATLLTIQVGA